MWSVGEVAQGFKGEAVVLVPRQSRFPQSLTSSREVLLSSHPAYTLAVCLFFFVPDRDRRIGWSSWCGSRDMPPDLLAQVAASEKTGKAMVFLSWFDGYFLSHHHLWTHVAGDWHADKWW